MELLTLVAFLHLGIAILLCLFVLLQDSKGGALGALGGGGGTNTVFGSTGAASFLVKATRTLGVLFAISCIWLAWRTNHGGEGLMDKFVPESSVEGTLSTDPATTSEPETPELPSEKQ